MIIENKEFSVDANGTTCWGIVITPDNTTNYPIIIFAPGDGQKGNGTESTLSLLYSNGSPLALARDGKLPGYTVVGLQGVAGRGIQPDQVGFIISRNYFNSLSKIMVSGLSLGAELSLEAVGSRTYNKIFDFCVAMSTPSVNTDIIDWSGLNCPVLLFHGDKDSGLTDYWNSVRVRDAINAAKPGMAYLITYPGGHGDWPKYFSTDFRFTIGDITYNNIYDFYNKVTPEYRFPIQTAQTSPQPNTTMALIPNFTVTASGNVVTLDPSKSEGTPTSFNWDFRDSSGNYVKPEVMSGMLTGNNKLPGILTVKLYKSVNIILQLMYPGGKVEKSIVWGALIPSEPAPIPAPVTKNMIGKYIVEVYDDGSLIANKL